MGFPTKDELAAAIPVQTFSEFNAETVQILRDTATEHDLLAKGLRDRADRLEALRPFGA